jgi:hypothetical protein
MNDQETDINKKDQDTISDTNMESKKQEIFDGRQKNFKFLIEVT